MTVWAKQEMAGCVMQLTALLRGARNAETHEFYLPADAKCFVLREL